MDGMHGAALGPWSTGYLAATLLMWTVMMALMMLPSAVPVIRLFAMSSRRAAAQGGMAVPTALFVGGYLLVWTLFSAGATFLQSLLRALALLAHDISLLHPLIGAAILVGAGIYQFTGWKATCLTHCQTPLDFLLRHWQTGRAGAVRMGLKHGFYCLGCCWALMLVLFAVGVMSIGWVVALATFVLVEKVYVRGLWFSRAAGAALFGGALLLLMEGTQ